MRRVLPPDFGFDALRTRLLAEGWREVPVPGLRPPLVPGEPELARFARGDATLAYSCNPALWFRVVEGDRVPDLPAVTPAMVQGWLASTEPRARLRGCLAAAEMTLTHFVEEIARAASDLPAEMQAPAAAALARLQPLPAPAATGAFDLLTEPLRLQLLRRLLVDRPTVAAALVTRCWTGSAELTATAMIAAARLGLTAQYQQLRRGRLDGLAVTRREKEIVSALRKACLATLEGGKPGPGSGPRERFWRQVLGEGCMADDAGLMILSLTLPLPEAPDSPGDDGFCEVPAVAHWLGHDTGRGVSNPVRRWVPRGPYRIGMQVVEDSTGAGLLLTPAPEAALSLFPGRRLATREEWEAALRGPDGRRFPWGQSVVRPAYMPAVSPWGALWSGHPEWVRDGDRLLVAGSDPQARASYLRHAEPGECCALRVVERGPE